MTSIQAKGIEISSIQIVSLKPFLVFQSTPETQYTDITLFGWFPKFIQIESQFVLTCVWFHSFHIVRFIQVITTYSSHSFLSLYIFIAFTWINIKQLFILLWLKMWIISRFLPMTKSAAASILVHVFWCALFGFLWALYLKQCSSVPVFSYAKMFSEGVGNEQDNLKCIC